MVSVKAADQRHRLILDEVEIRNRNGRHGRTATARTAPTSSPYPSVRGGIFHGRGLASQFGGVSHRILPLTRLIIFDFQRRLVQLHSCRAAVPPRRTTLGA